MATLERPKASPDDEKMAKLVFHATDKWYGRPPMLWLTGVYLKRTIETRRLPDPMRSWDRWLQSVRAGLYPDVVTAIRDHGRKDDTSRDAYAHIMADFGWALSRSRRGNGGRLRIAKTNSLLVRTTAVATALELLGLIRAASIVVSKWREVEDATDPRIREANDPSARMKAEEAELVIQDGLACDALLIEAKRLMREVDTDARRVLKDFQALNAEIARNRARIAELEREVWRLGGVVVAVSSGPSAAPGNAYDGIPTQDVLDRILLGVTESEKRVTQVAKQVNHLYGHTMVTHMSAVLSEMVEVMAGKQGSPSSVKDGGDDDDDGDGNAASSTRTDSMDTTTTTLANAMLQYATAILATHYTHDNVSQ